MSLIPTLLSFVMILNFNIDDNIGVMDAEISEAVETIIPEATNISTAQVDPEELPPVEIKQLANCVEIVCFVALVATVTYYLHKRMKQQAAETVGSNPELARIDESVTL